MSTKTKPPKPYTTFPLFAHLKGYWAKVVDGRQKSFGKWEWPDQDGYSRSWLAALDRFRAFEEARARGEMTVDRPGLLTMTEVVNAYLTRQHARLEDDDLSDKMFVDCRTVCTAFRDAVGRSTTVEALERSPAAAVAHRDALSARLGWHAFNRSMAILTSLWRWAGDGTKGGPLRRDTMLARMWHKRSQKQLRRAVRAAEATAGKPAFDPAELAAILAHADPVLRAQVLLGYFAAFGNADVSDLPLAALRFDPPELPAGWALCAFPRPKTDVDRAAALPPVVVRALRAVLALDRPPAAPELAGLVFRTPGGRRFVGESLHHDAAGLLLKADRTDGIGQTLTRLRRRLGKCEQHGFQRRAGVPETDAWSACPEPGCAGRLAPFRTLGFYCLRRGAITDAVGAADPDVLHHWRGHVLAGMSRVYVKSIDPAALMAIAERLGRKSGIDLEEVGAVQPSLSRAG